MNDPSLREEGLSMIPLGHPTHLAAKANGESSMLGKPGYAEIVKACVRQDPDGMVKPKLVEPQCPNCNCTGREGRLTV